MALCPVPAGWASGRADLPATMLRRPSIMKPASVIKPASVTTNDLSDTEYWWVHSGSR
jgi:hypothetical protein